MITFLFQIWNSISHFFLNLLFPVECLGCEKDGTFLCEACRLGIRNVAAQVCAFCYRRSEGGFTCGACKARGALLDGLLVMQNYDLCPLLVRLIHGFKYQYFRELAGPLAQELQAFFVKEFQELCFDGFWDFEVIFCPIPLSFGRENGRGFNQSRLLLDHLGDFPVVELLKRVHFQRAQRELNKKERARNILGAFQVTPAAGAILEREKALVVLVDDVATTLATLEEATKVLKREGFGVVMSLVLARKY